MKTLLPLKVLSLTIFLMAFSISSFAQVDACITSNTHTITSKTIAMCRGEYVNLVANNCLGNTTPAQTDYSWVKIGSGAPPYNGQFFFRSDTGRFVVTVTNMLDASTDKDTIRVVFRNAGAVFNINANALVKTKCETETITLIATTGFTSYRWYIETDSATALGNTSNLNVSTVPGGTANYVATAWHAASSCTVRDTINVYTFPTPMPNLGPDTNLCQGQSITLSPTGLAPGTYQYSWNGAAFAPASPRTVSTTSNVTLTVKGPFPNPCTGSDNITVTVNPNPVISFGSPSVNICYGASTVLNPSVTNATGPYIFSWTPAATLSDDSIQTPTASPASNTTYTVIVKVAASGCRDTTSQNVVVNPSLTASVAFSDTTICPGDAVQLQANASGGTAPLTYSWSPNTSIINGNTLIPTVNPTSGTTYTLTVTDAQSCKKTAAVNIDMLWVNLGGNDTIAVIGDSIKMEAYNPSTSGYSFRWKDPAGTNIGAADFYKVTTPGIYTIEVYNPVTMCFVTDNKEAFFAAEIIQKVFVPNAFNPDMADSDNKNLRVYGNNISNTNFIFKVYNKWGELVYETKNFDEANLEGWNGTLNNKGQPMNIGVYTYTVSGQFYDGGKFEQTGTANLIR
ncbi:MAG: gliding motility-associated C-terminal domain-containing protein [Cytophagaceae bacterium]|nr:gliding motility-associated C-terminal domain-containing protein [Cytophagaceae bacterium]